MGFTKEELTQAIELYKSKIHNPVEKKKMGKFNYELALMNYGWFVGYLDRLEEKWTVPPRDW